MPAVGVPGSAIHPARDDVLQSHLDVKRAYVPCGGPSPSGSEQSRARAATPRGGPHVQVIDESPQPAYSMAKHVVSTTWPTALMPSIASQAAPRRGSESKASNTPAAGAADSVKFASA